MSYPFILPGVCYAGPGSLRYLGEELRRLEAKHVLLLCDPGIVAAGLCQEVEEIIKKNGIGYEIFDEVELEPSAENVEKAAEIAKKENYDVIIGLGGGSSLDVAKGAAVLVTNGGRIQDYVGIEMIPKPGLPTVLIPTTAGTGAEVTLNAIFTFKEEQVKKGVVSRYLRAAVAIVDPKLTLSCPPKVTAAAGMDALVHAVESYTAVKATIQTDLYAFEAIKLIARTLRRAVLMGSNLEARNAMAWGSYLAGVALANAGVGAVHALAYPLGGRFHVSHGVANGLLFPYVLEFNVVANLEKFAQVAAAMGEEVKGLSLREAAFKTVEAVKKLAADIGLPQSLKEVGVSAADIETLTEGAVQQTRLLANNPRALTKEEIKKIYQRAL